MQADWMSGIKGSRKVRDPVSWAVSWVQVKRTLRVTMRCNNILLGFDSGHLLPTENTENLGENLAPWPACPHVKEEMQEMLFRTRKPKMQSTELTMKPWQWSFLQTLNSWASAVIEHGTSTRNWKWESQAGVFSAVWPIPSPRWSC